MPDAGLPWRWGATPEEHARAYPADALLPAPVARMTRALTVQAPPELAWRWLCQLALAPYSYDWIDNRGRRSPRELVPGTERLEVGQVMATVFRLTELDDGRGDDRRSWTARTSPSAERVAGPWGVTYAVEPMPGGPPGAARCRMLARIAVPSRTRFQRARALAVAWGDLVMMRKQLLTLRDLAERDARDGRGDWAAGAAGAGE